MKALTFQKPSSQGIVLSILPVFMHTAIHLHNQVERQTDKVCYILIYNILSAKAQSKLLAPKKFPQPSFRVRRHIPHIFALSSSIP